MASLRIVNIPEPLRIALKVGAAQRGLTLNEHVIELLEAAPSPYASQEIPEPARRNQRAD